jgi:hypothetical protein
MKTQNSGMTLTFCVTFNSEQNRMYKTKKSHTDWVTQKSLTVADNFTDCYLPVSDI